MKKVIKDIAFAIFDLCGGNALLRAKCNSPIVIFWHSVADTYHPIIEAETVSTENFIKQIEYLHKHHEIISIEEYNRRYISRNFKGNEVVITFDDGYKNNLTIAAPILKKYGIPFTVFVSTRNIELQERFYVLDPRLIIIGAELTNVKLPSIDKNFTLVDEQQRIDSAYEVENIMKKSPLELALKIDEELRAHITKEQYEHLRLAYPNMEPMTWEDVAILAENFDCIIGSHCVDHCCCHSGQSLTTLKFQLQDSKKSIEEHISKPCDYFAYPNGDFCSLSNDIVEHCYKMGFSTRHQRVYQNGETLGNVCRVPAAHEFKKFKFLYTTQTMGIF